MATSGGEGQKENGHKPCLVILSKVLLLRRTWAIMSFPIQHCHVRKFGLSMTFESIALVKQSSGFDDEELTMCESYLIERIIRF